MPTSGSLTERLYAFHGKGRTAFLFSPYRRCFALLLPDGRRAKESGSPSRLWCFSHACTSLQPGWGRCEWGSLFHQQAFSVEFPLTPIIHLPFTISGACFSPAQGFSFRGQGCSFSLFHQLFFLFISCIPNPSPSVPSCNTSMVILPLKRKGRGTSGLWVSISLEGYFVKKISWKTINSVTC